MRRHLTYLALALALSACGGGDAGESDGDSTSTTTSVATSEAAPDTTTPMAEDTETTAAPQATGSGEFCDEILRGDEDMDITDSARMEEILTAEFEHLNDLPAEVPGEIAGEWSEFLELTDRLLTLYAEYGFDLLAIPEAELTEMQQLLEPSQSVILDYCGLTDFIEDEPDSESGTTDTTLPEAVPEGAYSPPGMFESHTEGILTLIRSDASFGEIVTYYEEVMGEAGQPEGEGYVGFSDSGAPPDYIIGIEQEEDHVLVTVAVPDS